VTPASTSLSVVVPVLNEAARLPDLFASLPASGLQATDEVIIVDGGSTDDTVSVARAHGATVLDARRGRGTQLRRGAVEAAGDVLVFLHADMQVGAGALERVRAAFTDPSVVASGMRQRLDGKRAVYRLIERAANLRVRRGWVYGDSGLAVRRAKYEEVGGFRDVPLFEDVDLSRRVRRAGRVVLVEDAELVVSTRRWERRGAIIDP